jgi:alpha-beta hydrolase superfamily lysophospholipase
MPERVTLTTEDGIKIAGLFWSPDMAKVDHYGPRGALLMHMMPATKESWSDFAPLLAEAGFSVLAIDLRGHGESRDPHDLTFDYKLFTSREHRAKRLDAEAAVAWFAQEHRLMPANLAAVGASIGANLSIQLGADHPEIPAVVALSPGFDYHGVTTLDKVRLYRPEKKLLLAASEEDELSFRTNRELKEIKLDTDLHEFADKGHGTTMFVNDPEFMVEVALWLSDNVPGAH